jgi:nucleoid-associated protein YgaU
MSASYLITLKASDGRTVLAPHGAGASGPVAGYGGFNGVGRPQNAPVTEWVGRDLEEYPLPLFLHHRLMPNNTSVERARTILDSWGRPLSARTRPPVIMVSGDLFARPSSRLWVISDVQFAYDSEYTERDVNGVYLSLPVTVNLLEWNPNSTVEAFSSGLKPWYDKKVSPTSSTKYTVVKGDTAKRISIKLTGADSLWKDIIKLNKKHGNRDFKVGETIKIPLVKLPVPKPASLTPINPAPFAGNSFGSF